MSRLVREAERDVRKVAAFEDNIYKHPVKTLEMRYERGEWLCQPLEDHTGDITFSLAPSFESDRVSFEPDEVEYEGILFEPRACCLSQYATFIAFSMENSGKKTSTSKRLLNRNNPEDSSIAIVAEEEPYFPLDGSVDGKLVPGTRRTGIVAFEPFTTPIIAFKIVFLPKPTKANPDPDPETIRVRGSDIREITAANKDAPSLMDAFEKKVQRLLTTKQREHKAALKPQKGCMLSVPALVLGGAVLARTFL